MNLLTIVEWGGWVVGKIKLAWAWLSGSDPDDPQG